MPQAVNHNKEACREQLRVPYGAMATERGRCDHSARGIPGIEARNYTVCSSAVVGSSTADGSSHRYILYVHD